MSYFHVEKRNGKVFIDEYDGADFNNYRRAVLMFPTRKLADAVAEEMNSLASKLTRIEHDGQKD